jgi:hypothetical protein
VGKSELVRFHRGKGGESLREQLALPRVPLPSRSLSRRERETRGLMKPLAHPTLVKTGSLTRGRGKEGSLSRLKRRPMCRDVGAPPAWRPTNHHCGTPEAHTRLARLPRSRRWTTASYRNPFLNITPILIQISTNAIIRINLGQFPFSSRINLASLPSESFLLDLCMLLGSSPLRNGGETPE